MNNQAVFDKPKRVSLWQSLEWCSFTPNRISRIRYFGLSMLWLGICLVLGAALFVIDELNIYACFIIGLIAIPNTIILKIRRIHDLNFSGWWLLLGLIPYVGNILIWLVLLFWPGSKGENKFGEKPQSPTKRHYFMSLWGIIFYVLSFFAYLNYVTHTLGLI